MFDSIPIEAVRWKFEEIGPISDGQRMMCHIWFSIQPSQGWLNTFLSRVDSHPTETNYYGSGVTLFRDRFREAHFIEMIKSSVEYTNEILELSHDIG